jgi:archaellum component FlaC
MLKKLFFGLVILVLLLSAWFNRGSLETLYHRVMFFSYCANPIEYKIGSIDTEFELSSEKLNLSAKNAADMWNSTYGKDLFVYNPQASLEIDLAYDERQSLTQQIVEIDNKVEQDKSKLSVEIGEHQKLYEDLKNRTNELSKEIQYWNDRGGAPKDTYEELIREQNRLQDQIDEFNQRSSSLDATTNNLNNQINELNSTISTFNNILKTKPEAGIYIPTENKIKIYSFGDEKQLSLTIAHEFGHALGLSHISTPDALMNPVASANSRFTPEDIDSLKNFCREQNRVEFLKNEIWYFLTNFSAEITKDLKN